MELLRIGALEIAAAGGHNLLFVGPPGSGKSMLAQRLPGILPPLSAAELLETSMVHSVAGLIAREIASDYEILVIDDGSTDGTWEWLQKQPDVLAIR